MVLHYVFSSYNKYIYFFLIIRAFILSLSTASLRQSAESNFTRSESQNWRRGGKKEKKIA